MKSLVRGFAVLELVILLGILGSLGGYIAWKHSKDKSDWYTGPDNMKGTVDHYRNKIADCMGWDKPLKRYYVKAVPGTRKGKRCWAAYLPEAGQEVCGCAIGRGDLATMWLVYDPSTPNQVPNWIIEHEVMEAERTGHGDYSDNHPDIYKKCLDDPGNWRLWQGGTMMLEQLMEVRGEDDSISGGIRRMSILLPD